MPQLKFFVPQTTFFFYHPPTVLIKIHQLSPLWLGRLLRAASPLPWWGSVAARWWGVYVKCVRLSVDASWRVSERRDAHKLLPAYIIHIYTVDDDGRVREFSPHIIFISVCCRIVLLVSLILCVWCDGEGLLLLLFWFKIGIWIKLIIIKTNMNKHDKILLLGYLKKKNIPHIVCTKTCYVSV